MTSEDETTTGMMTLQTCDIKIEQNTKGYNISVHVYEFATQEKIDQVVENAVYAMRRTGEEIAKELMVK